jgi:Rps23 Pro-64 3,4-dihydroxylase Tpa1-like proline 4-hydroxylase
MQIINVCDVLDADSFQNILVAKKNIIGKGDGALTLNKDGSITRDSRSKIKMADGYTLKGNQYLISKDAFFNYQYTIEGFEQFLGKEFTQLLQNFKDILESNGVKNPRPYMCRAYRHNMKIKYHKHGLAGIKLSKFWLVIYYMHPNWDPKYGGALSIGLTENEITHTIDCLSNSLVAHNGYYGHGVKELIKGYEGDRDIFLSHWVSD